MNKAKRSYQRQSPAKIAVMIKSVTSHRGNQTLHTHNGFCLDCGIIIALVRVWISDGWQVDETSIVCSCKLCLCQLMLVQPSPTISVKHLEGSHHVQDVNIRARISLRRFEPGEISLFKRT